MALIKISKTPWISNIQQKYDKMFVVKYISFIGNNYSWNALSLATTSSPCGLFSRGQIQTILFSGIFQCAREPYWEPYIYLYISMNFCLFIFLQPGIIYLSGLFQRSCFFKGAMTIPESRSTLCFNPRRKNRQGCLDNDQLVLALLNGFIICVRVDKPIHKPGARQINSFESVNKRYIIHNLWKLIVSWLTRNLVSLLWADQ